jgi:hypothetical protein
MSNDIESLKPCPDCGRTPKVQDAQTLSGDIWNIVCYRCNIETGVCKSYREAVENWNATVTAHSDDGEPVPRHRCNGVNGGERHGTSNKCNICGEYREGWFDENGFPIVPLDLQAEPARPDEGDKWIDEVIARSWTGEFFVAGERVTKQLVAVLREYKDFQSQLVAERTRREEADSLADELALLMEGVIKGDYEPDSFTLQPYRQYRAKYPAQDSSNTSESGADLEANHPKS